MKQSSMQRKIAAMTVVAALGLSAFGVRLSMAADKDSDITTIMKKGFKGTKQKPSIVKKALDGTATKEELKTLAGLIDDLTKTTPPKGEKKDWDERTAALVKAADEVVKGNKDGIKDLKAASACKDCHKLHQKDE